MKTSYLLTIPSIFHMLLVITLISCGTQSGERNILPDLPEGVQALSVTGELLYSAQPPASYLERFTETRDTWQADKSNADNLIWYGRWAAYCGDYREAIRIFTMGIERFPDDPRMYRHRGHRYITIREFERAIQDFEKASDMVAGQKDEIEPDGMPNPLNIPVSTLHSNIYYHLGLAKYLQGDLSGALKAWDSDMALQVNDDMTVATMHWIYMALMELGQKDEAMARLGLITENMHVIENDAYYQLCLFYKGTLSREDLAGNGHSAVMGDAMLYGLGNWYLHHEASDAAMDFFQQILDRGSWASFGYIAAEVKMAAL